jgi:hypothetical protein
VTWADSEHGIIAREVALDDGRVSEPVVVPSVPPNQFVQKAATWVLDHWVIAGQDYSGLVLVHVRGNSVSQRRLLTHGPAACSETDSCGMSSAWRWAAIHLSVAAGEDGAWVGVVDERKSGAT